MAFKVAAREALKKGILEAKPVLLEPIASLKITLPDVYTGDVMGDLNKKRARVLGMTPDNKGTTEILADIPYIELYGYGTRLRSMTQGSGDFSYQLPDTNRHRRKSQGYRWKNGHPSLLQKKINSVVR